MKKNFISMYQLLSSHSLKYLLATALLMVLIQSGVFLYLGRGGLKAFYQWVDHPLIKASYLVAIIAVVTRTNYSVIKGNSKYTIKRLGTTDRCVLISYTCHIISLIIILVGIQLGILILASLYYQTCTGILILPHSLYLSSFHSEFYHVLLPLSDSILLLNNLALYLFVGLGCAFSFLMVMKGLKANYLGWLCIFCIYHLNGGYSGTRFAMIVFLAAASLIIYLVLVRGKINED